MPLTHDCEMTKRKEQMGRRAVGKPQKGQCTLSNKGEREGGIAELSAQTQGKVIPSLMKPHSIPPFGQGWISLDLKLPSFSYLDTPFPALHNVLCG